MKTPTIKEDIDWSAVIEMAEEYKILMDTNPDHEDMFDSQYLVEEVFFAVYGKDFFDWVNTKIF